MKVSVQPKAKKGYYEKSKDRYELLCPNFKNLLQILKILKMATNKLRVLWERKKDGSSKRELYVESPSVILVGLVFFIFIIAIIALAWIKIQS